jgi:hypothetical protein
VSGHAYGLGLFERKRELKTVQLIFKKKTVQLIIPSLYAGARRGGRGGMGSCA